LKTSEEIAEKHGVGQATVRRAANYAKAIDKIVENLGRWLTLVLLVPGK